MKYKYANSRDAITLNKDSYIYWNGYTDCVYIYDRAIRKFDGWNSFDYAELSMKKFEMLKKNGLIERCPRKNTFGNYWIFTDKALAMDDIILYAPYIRRKATT